MAKIITLDHLISIKPKPWHRGKELFEFCERHVFVNIPYDNKYRPLELALCATLISFGFQPIMAKSNRIETVRLNKIGKLMKACKYGVSDLSRITRHNMSFEHGMMIALPNIKACCALVKDEFKAMQYLSDMNGFDTTPHYGDKRTLITNLTNWILDNTMEDIPPERRDINASMIIEILPLIPKYIKRIKDYSKLPGIIDGLFVSTVLNK